MRLLLKTCSEPTLKKRPVLKVFCDVQTLYSKYRSYAGWPGIFLEGGMKISDIMLVDKKGNEMKGMILALYKTSICIAGCNGSIEIGTIQVPSKKAVNAKAYCLGKGLKVGDFLS